MAAVTVASVRRWCRWQALSPRRERWAIALLLVLLLGQSWWGLQHRTLAPSPPRRSPAPISSPTASPGSWEATRAQYESVMQQVPSGTDTAVAVDRLFASARRTGVMLGAGSYRWVQDPVAHVALYQADLPITASYDQVAQFLADLLAHDKWVAIRSLDFKESTAGTVKVEVRLVWLYRD